MISFKVNGLREFQGFISSFGKKLAPTAAQAVADYLLGDTRRGLRHYPPKTTQKYVRTFTLQRGWHRTGVGLNSRVVNDVPYAPFVPRWKKYGWRQWADVISSNVKHALAAAEAAIRKLRG